MESIYLIGDAHTVNAFRICGIDGFTANIETSGIILKDLIERDDSLIIVITSEFAEYNSEMIKRFNPDSQKKVIIEIPGIDDAHGMGKSLTSYITEALGVAL